ncbi:MAG: hypothetical protein ACK5XN_33990 [Bacteroidota bacterium]
MKVLVQNDPIKAIRRLAKLKSMAGITSTAIKESLIYKKGTTKRREKLLSKRRVIRSFKHS